MEEKGRKGEGRGMKGVENEGREEREGRGWGRRRVEKAYLSLDGSENFSEHGWPPSPIKVHINSALAPAGVTKWRFPAFDLRVNV